MRIYKDFIEALPEIWRDLGKFGVRQRTQTMQDKYIFHDPEYETLEITNYNYMVVHPRLKDIEEVSETLGKRLNKKLFWKEYCEEEFRNRISNPPVNPGTSWKLREDYWSQFLETSPSGPVFSYTYSERISPQIETLIEKIKKYPDNRNLVLSIWDPCLDLKRVGEHRVPCLLPGTPILTSTGIKEIENSLTVLTHKGIFSPAYPVSRNYKGPIISIKPVGLPSFEITPEHPILIVKGSEFYKGKRGIDSLSYKRGMIYFGRIENPSPKEQWIRADEVERFDYLVLRIPSEIKDIPEISPELCRAIGYFLAEGEIIWDKRHGKIRPKGIRMNFSYGDKENGYIEDFTEIVKKVWGRNPTRINEKRRNIRLLYVSKEIGLFFSKFGAKSKEKRLPLEFLYLPKEKQKEIVEGWIRGDGSFSKDNFYKAVSTCSPELAGIMRLILLRLGIDHSFGIRSPREGIIYGRKVIFRLPSYHFQFSPHNSPKRSFMARIIKNNTLYTRIQKIERKDYNGLVYNLEVPGDETYSLLSGCVHNCSVMYQFLFRRGQLDLIYIMRSCDYITHLFNDIALAVKFLEYISEKVEMKMGSFYHFISSLHIYRKDAKNVI